MSILWSVSKLLKTLLNVSESIEYIRGKGWKDVAMCLVEIVTGECRVT